MCSVGPLDAHPTQRTDCAEQFAAKFTSLPLAREFVLRNLRFLDGLVQKEVCDLMFVLDEKAILVQMKCQQHPEARSGDKLDRWIGKRAEAAASQAGGAIRSVARRDFWCQHERRGRVDFSAGQLKVEHGIVLIEHLGRRVALPASLPLSYKGVPISYLSVNDFLNVVNELRAFPEIISYLGFRARLPCEMQLTVGHEKTLFENYLLAEDSFSYLTTFNQAVTAISQRAREVKAAIARKKAADRDAHAVEQVADALAERSLKWAEGLSPELAVLFDPMVDRKGYLAMQEQLCALTLAERRIVGFQLNGVIEDVRNKQGPSMSYRVAFFDSKPDILWVLASSKQEPRPELLKRGQMLLRAGLAHYGKHRGMLILERDGESFEVIMAPAFSPSEEEKAVGQHLFGAIKTRSEIASLVPPCPPAAIRQ